VIPRGAWRNSGAGGLAGWRCTDVASALSRFSGPEQFEVYCGANIMSADHFRRRPTHLCFGVPLLNHESTSLK